VSRALARRRRAGLGNPIGSSDVSDALGYLAIGGLVGAGLGALVGGPTVGTGALNGAASGVAITGVGGLVVAIFSEKNRSPGLATAGIGLGGLVLFGIVTSLVGKAAA
jgi:hypothetical protein